MQVAFNLSSELYSQYFSFDFVGEETLTQGEKAILKSANIKRKRDFSTGRFCARKALELLGYSSPEILIGVNAEPVWPRNIIGSISHAEGLAGAIVSDSAELVSLGLDIEKLGRIKPPVWDILFTENEQKFLKLLPEEDIPLYATVLFSMKECFYKFQFPLTKTYLDFIDVEIALLENQFNLSIIKGFTNNKYLPYNNTLEWVKIKDYIITICY